MYDSGLALSLAVWQLACVMHIYVQLKWYRKFDKLKRTELQWNGGAWVHTCPVAGANEANAHNLNK